MYKYYHFRDEEGNEHEVMLSKSELEEFKAEHPTWEPVIHAPHMSTSTSATFVDGHAPASRKEAVKLELEIAKMESVQAGTHYKKREHINKEIKELKKRRKAPVGTNKGG